MLKGFDSSHEVYNPTTVEIGDEFDADGQRWVVRTLFGRHDGTVKGIEAEALESGEGTAESTLDQRERVAEAAILAEYQRQNLHGNGHSCALERQAEEKRDIRILRLARMVALPESKVRDRVMGATVNVHEGTWRVHQAASWVAHL